MIQTVPLEKWEIQIVINDNQVVTVDLIDLEMPVQEFERNHEKFEQWFPEKFISLVKEKYDIELTSSQALQLKTLTREGYNSKKKAFDDTAKSLFTTT